MNILTKMDLQYMFVFVWITIPSVVICQGINYRFWYHTERCNVTPHVDCDCFLEDGLPMVDCAGRNLTSPPIIDASEYNNTLALLDLSNNNLDTDIKPFLSGLAIQRYDLSDNNPPITKINEFDYDNIYRKYSLTLNVQQNNITDFPNLTGMVNLQELDLSYNQISSLNNFLLRKTPVLRILNLIGNHITTMYGHFSSSLQQLYLGLSDVSFVSTPTAFFNVSEPSQLEVFGIIHNEMGIFRDYAQHLLSLPPVEVFQLSHRGITIDLLEYNITLPRCNTSLKVIDLSFNGLNSIPNKFISDFTNLEVLNLEWNSIRGIYRIEASRSLQKINLSNNKIFSLSRNTFVGFPDLVEIDLSSNEMMAVTEWSFPTDLSNGNTLIKLGGNDFMCNCHMKWLLELAVKQLETGVGPFDMYEFYTLQCYRFLSKVYLLDMYDYYFHGSGEDC